MLNELLHMFLSESRWVSNHTCYISLDEFKRVIVIVLKVNLHYARNCHSLQLFTLRQCLDFILNCTGMGSARL